ncbi:MAG: CRISPR-associated helicase Cas3' [Cyanobacteria bacterium P01_G01_bin.54]
MQPKLKPDRLLAKSVEGRWKGSYSLVGHTADVVRAVTTLVDAKISEQETLGDRILQQFDLPCDINYLRNTVRLAAYIHDWGKANSHFQGVVRQDMADAAPRRNPLKTPQLVRHEILSLLIAWEFRDWLKAADGDFMTAFVAAGGHHLKLGGKEGKATDEVGELRPCEDDRITLYLRHPDFKRLIRFGKKQLNCPAKVKLAGKLKPTWWASEVKQRRESLLRQGFRDWEQDNPVLTAVVKALLVAGDAVGSAIPATKLRIDQWLKEALRCTLTEQDLDKVIEARLEGHKLRRFQIKLGDITERVGLARAGCGTGKTVGAYNWAKRHAIGRKLFFCYPTTGTSTEGFVDYVQKEIKSVLLHGRAEVDLAMKQTGEEAEVLVDEEELPNEVDLKLSSFKAWDKPAIVCTIDTVLGLTQCNRRPMYSFPAMANAAFVFDEVHSYDNALFGALLRFLETVKAPILLMSASFLPAQVDAIKAAVGNFESVEGHTELEKEKRYHFHYADEANWDRVQQELEAGGKVLWVCNQVSTAIAVYEKAQKLNFDSQLLLYHSRFCYEHRVQHHEAVIDAFKPENKEPVLAITTQVAEMSLDLSATLLISQIAEPPALIQRLGRLNRKYCGHALDAWFYLDPKKQPYSLDKLKQGRAMIDTFLDQAVTQADLAQWLDQHPDLDFNPKKQSVWLDGAWRTYPTALRESGVTVTCLLEQYKEVWSKRPRNQLNLHTVPLVVDNWRAANWERHKHFPIAPMEHFEYDPEKGAFPSTSNS